MKPCINTNNKTNQTSKKKAMFPENVTKSQITYTSYQINNNVNTPSRPEKDAKEGEKKHVTVKEFSSIILQNIQRECNSLAIDINALQIRNKHTQESITKNYTDIKKGLKKVKLTKANIVHSFVTIQNLTNQLNKRQQVLNNLNEIKSSLNSLNEIFSELVKNYTEQEKSIKTEAQEVIKKLNNKNNKKNETLKKFENLAMQEKLLGTDEIKKTVDSETNLTTQEKSILFKIFQQEQQYIKAITTMQRITINKTHDLFKKNHNAYQKIKNETKSRVV